MNETEINKIKKRRENMNVQWTGDVEVVFELHLSILSLLPSNILNNGFEQNSLEKKEYSLGC